MGNGFCSQSICTAKGGRIFELRRNGVMATLRREDNVTGGKGGEFNSTEKVSTTSVQNPNLQFESAEHRFSSDSDADVTELDEGVVDVIGADYDLVEEKTKKVRTRTRELLREINIERDDKLASDANVLPPVQDDETMAWVRTAVRAGDERKALNPVAIRVMRLTYVTSFMVALTGKSTPQLRAIANLVEDKMFKEHGIDPKRSSGTAQSGWLLLDCTFPFILPATIFLKRKLTTAMFYCPHILIMQTAT